MNLLKSPKKSLKKIAIVAKHTIADNHLAYIKKLIKFLELNKRTVVCDFNIEPHVSGKKGMNRAQIMDHADLVIVLGGDGTILKTAACATEANALVLGVNFGNLGFLTEVTPEGLIKSLGKIFKGDYMVDERALLRVTHYHNSKKSNTFLALNEAVINQGSVARLVKLDISINDQNVASIKTDGLIASTPTGSTAHSLSAGGPIVHPRLSSIILTPICPAILTMRPIVIPDDNELKIKIATERDHEKPVSLTVDGQNSIPLVYGDEIKIRKSGRKLNMVRFNDRYFQLLTDKLSWGK